MNPRHPAWALLPIFGILAGLFFRPSEDLQFPSPRPSDAEVRSLCLPDGNAIRFRKAPDMTVWMSETELPQKGQTFAEALAMCEDLSRQTGEVLRLPTIQEWRQAARSGIAGLPYPWGYDPDLPADLVFARSTPPSAPGPAFGYGFRDLAGGVWEWTREGVLVGSAWSETNPETLQIDHVWVPPEGYGDLDTGIRLVWEE